MATRKSIPDNLRKMVFERDGYICRYCGNETQRPHADHVYPESRGGETTLANLVTACPGCNFKKKATVGIWPMPLVSLPKKKRAKRKTIPRGKLSDAHPSVTGGVILFIACIGILNTALFFAFHLSPYERIYIASINLILGNLLYAWRRTKGKTL